jgi:hypothetical protein
MRLSDLAEHGVISTADARSLGIGTAELRRRARGGELLPLVRGWYAVRSADDTTAPWEGGDRFETAQLRHRLLTVALLRSFAGRAVASHQSAVVLHGGRLWRSDLGTVHLVRSADDHSRHRRQAVIHPRVGVSPVRTEDGLETVPMAMAVVQVGLTPLSVTDGPSPMESLVAADGALHDEQITQEQLQAALTLHANHPHIHGVRLLLRHADGRHESVGETRLAHALRLLHYRFTPQVKVSAGGRGWRSDFGLDDDAVFIEFDGLAKYSGGLVNPDPSKVREALAQEKWRQAQLEDSGREVVRVMWSELDDLSAIDSKVQRAVARARLRHPA